MLSNHVYNLMKQLVQENKSLWRIKNNYKNDAAACASCAEYWDKLEKDKEQQVKELTELVRNHIG